MIRLDDLSPFSRRFATRLFAKHPDWRQFGSIPSGEYWADGVLQVDITSPLGDRQLSIDTNDDEVTVYFGGGGWHSHNTPIDDSETEAFEGALAEVEAILSEDLAILTRYVNGEVHSAETLWRDQEINFRGADRVEVVSWLGSRDGVHHAA